MTGSAKNADEELRELAAKQVALGEVRGAPAADPVNVPMIRHWLAAMGDENPVYLEQGLAPPTMAQVWTMPGLSRGPKERSPVDDMMTALNGHGYTGVVATNCEQTYHRYVRVGELLTPATRFSGLAGPKRTALGVGYFATWHITWYSGDDEPVAEMMFRVLKFRPPQKTEPQEQAAELPPYPLQPAVNQDTAFFWDGAGQGELRIQSCADCGELRHPPGPLCPRCRSAERTHRVASGTGTLFSYVVHHHPPVPGRETPFVVGVVELPEGVRIVGNVVDCPIEEVRIGMPLRVTYRRMDDRLVLPMWAPEGR
ncbi:bifunctional MaoC family dehydratase N-terminal/OB-fold nucleic acid binding domain-containing protein [Nonomuraea candida]|uniref:bifunctional MaoC family dehydratase N-terminal/OB-fold nucleic acid binding domain-containing protein n=1 Tax=Nonomuraea candida TaxID=359159 RepID=UPI000A06E0D0|nr:bifunctional MaoC family dehydratase N-terminal/OB-fold nucleic acid binding domain-containing protein [Nonomuraea candida]